MILATPDALKSVPDPQRKVLSTLGQVVLAYPGIKEDPEIQKVELEDEALLSPEVLPERGHPLAIHLMTVQTKHPKD